MKNVTYEEFIQDILNTRGRFACGEEYHERHHIVPKCMGGSDDNENLIDLYAKEHFEAHRLLAAENPNNDKLVYAWWMMSTMKSEYTKERYEVSAAEYEEAKKAYANIMSNKMSGEGNPFYGKCHSEETKNILRQQRTGMKASDETRKKISNICKGRFQDPTERMKCGRPHTEEWKQEQSVRMSGVNHPMFGRNHTEETKEKMKIYAQNRPEEHNKKISEIQKERFKNPENNPMYGKHHTEETKEKIRQANIGRKLSDEAKQKISAANAGENSWNSQRVIQYTLLGEKIKVWPYIKAAETELHISHISQCINGSRKSAGGFLWRKEDDPLTEDEINELRTTSKHRQKGVSWHKRSNKWAAYIKINGKTKHLGYFNDLEEAISARLDAENKITI